VVICGIWLNHTLCYFGTLSEHCSVVFNFMPAVKHCYKLQFSSCVISWLETVKRFPNPYRTEQNRHLVSTEEPEQNRIHCFCDAKNSNRTEPQFFVEVEQNRTSAVRVLSHLYYKLQRVVRIYHTGQAGCHVTQRACHHVCCLLLADIS